MKGVYSLWSKPLNKKDKGHPFNNLMDAFVFWTTSVKMNRKYFDSLELVTDKAGYEILINQLKLPFDSVHVILDECNIFSDRLWAVGKMKAYTIQNEPFMHLDHDVFWTKPIPNKLKNADIFSQCIEQNSTYFNDVYIRQLHNVNETLETPKYWIKNLKYAHNTGIFGGNDIKFIKEYCELAWKMALELNDMNYINFEEYNIIFEQYYLSVIAKSKNIKITSLIENIESIEEADEYGFTHFISGKKRILENVAMVHNICARDYPTEYKKCYELAKL